MTSELERLFEIVAIPDRGISTSCIRINVWAANDHNVASLAALFTFHRPGRAAFGVPEPMGCEYRTQFHLIPSAIPDQLLSTGKVGRIIAILKIAFPAGFNHGHIAFHHHVFLRQ